MTFQSRLFSAVLLCAAGFAQASAQTAAPAEPAHFVFVFHPGKPVIEVFDGGSLTPLATPRVGFGAFRAFGLPGSNDTGAAAKFYILTPGSVRVLDGGFNETGAIPLSVPALPGRGAAAMSSDGATLLVATSAGVYLIDTATDSIDQYLTAGFPVAGVALSTDAGRAYLIAAGDAMLRPVDLKSRALLDELALPPAELESWDRSQNGLRALGLAGDAIYEINQTGTVRFTGDIAPLLRSSADAGEWLAGRSARAVTKTPEGRRRLEATNSGWVYIEEAGRLWRESLLGGAAELVADARTQDVVRLGASGGWDASPSGEAVYVTDAAGKLARIDADPAIPVRTVALLEAGGEVEAVAPRVEQAGTLALVTTNNLVVAGGTPFQIVVKATDASGNPQSGVPVFFSNKFPAAAPVTCVTAITAANGEASIDCELGQVTALTQIQLTFSDTRGRSAPIVNVEARVPTDFEGLALIQGGGERIPLDIEYVIVAQVSRNRVPVVGETVVLITEPRNGALTCPRTALTDAQGKATFLCRSAIDLDEDVNSESVSFTITDQAQNTITDSIVVDRDAIAPTGLTKVQGDGSFVMQGNTVELVVSSFRDGAPRALTTLNITVLNPGTPPAMTCPLNARTNAEGIARFTCRAGTIFGGRKTVEVQVSDFGVLLAEPFKIVVTESTFGFGQTIEFVTDEDLRLPAGRPVLDAIQVRALTTGDDPQPAPNTTVYFFPLSPGEITIEPMVAQTDGEGIASVTVTVGCNANPVSVGVGLMPDDPFLDLQVRPLAGQFSQMTIVQGDNQSGAPGQPLNAQALVARTSDACGLPLAQQNVTWKVKPAFAASLRATVSRSDSLGRVSTLVTLGQYGGPFEIEVGSGSITTTFKLAVNLPATELRAVSGSGQTVASGQEAQQPLVVQALGTNGFGVSEVPVQWSVAEGPATITQSQTTTGGAGIAYARVRVTGAGGPRVRIQATSMGKTASFVLNGSDGPQAVAAGFANGASFQTGWTPGGTGSIFGTALANQLLSASSAPFPTMLGGVTVKINGTLVPIIFVSEGQINIQVPFNTPVGSATVEIDNNGKILTVSGVQISRVQPGVFEISVDGATIAAALHQDGTLIRPTSPARPGEVVQLFFTAGGPLNPAVPTNQPGPTNPLAFTQIPVVVKVGGVEQQAIASVYAPGLITAYQVNFTLGTNSTPGDRPLQLEMEGVASKTVTLPVAPAALALQPE
jgi:uncharacterized protein (TIGR03437 family)